MRPSACLTARVRVCASPALSVRHAAFDCLLVRRVDDGRFAETAFLFGRFVRQNMAVIRMMAYDFAAARNLEALRGAALCFHFWHCLSPSE